MKIRHLLIGVIILSMILVLGCGKYNFFSSKPYSETQFLMDTVIEITAYGPGAEEAVKEAFKEFKRLHDLTNNFDENSQVSMINRMAGKQRVVVDPDLVYLIQHSNDLADMVGGTFDISIGPLTDLWGIGRKGDYVPTQQEINNKLPLVDYRKIEVDSTNNMVYLPREGMMLDLGGVAKGYAADKAIEVLKAKGIKSALINAGGDVRVIGTKEGNPWRIGVQHPRDTNGVIAKLSLTQWDTMETSGDYQRYFIKDGVRYSHILDPHTGYQPREITSVTMVMNSSTDGDILSTAIFVLGVDKGLEVLKKFPGVEAIIITNEGKVIVTPGLEGKVEY